MTCVFEMFSIGIGPSSSHTVAPMRAAHDFATNYLKSPLQNFEIRVDLYASLASTGLGHGTQDAILAGLSGFLPENVKGRFCKPDNIHFHLHPQDYQAPHPNKITFTGLDTKSNTEVEMTYFSIGGGVVLDGNKCPVDPNGFNHALNGFASTTTSIAALESVQSFLDPKTKDLNFSSMRDFILGCKAAKMQIWEVVRLVEECYHGKDFVNKQIKKIWAVMDKSINKGLKKDGIIEPARLLVERRAKKLIRRSRRGINTDDNNRLRLSSFAFAVAEQNASRKRLVTAPTNGSAGVIPAVIKDWAEMYHHNLTTRNLMKFIFTAYAIGAVIKENASLAGSVLGCQAEIGSATAMAAAGLTAVSKGSVEQIENAAEIGLEHFLGLTCDPLEGYVMIPCIERNAIAANTAVTAAVLALCGSGIHRASLDEVIKAMKATGQDMPSKYKETAQGGLAVYLNC